MSLIELCPSVPRLDLVGGRGGGRTGHLHIQSNCAIAHPKDTQTTNATMKEVFKSVLFDRTRQEGSSF